MQLRPLVSVATLASAVLALSACGQDPRKADNPPAPPDLAANFTQPIDAKAADGSWSLKVRDTQLTLTRYGQPDLTVSAPGVMIEAHQATWIAKMPDNQQMTVKIYASPCSFPATTESHAFAAEIDLPAASPLSGCGDAVGGPATAPAPIAKK